ncbi:MAG TPA: hypothetical protein VMJ66_06300 [Geobacteraceae bacterium]|nr:hypothetical protein [Geobacteraceae bacterium]
MSIKLGEMLVEAGLLTQGQLDVALKNQVMFGGRLGTNLIEIGFLDEEHLARFLSKKLELPCATSEQLMSIPPDIAQLIPKEVADKYKVVPLGRERKRLTLAMLDPADLSVIDAISFITGFYISPLIAPELRLVESLEKLYGIKRDIRYVQISEKRREPPQLEKDDEVEVAQPPLHEEIAGEKSDVFDFSLPLVEVTEEVAVEEEIIDIEDVIETAVEPFTTEQAGNDQVMAEPPLIAQDTAEIPVAGPDDAQTAGTAPLAVEPPPVSPSVRDDPPAEILFEETGIEEFIDVRLPEPEPVEPEPVTPSTDSVAEQLTEAADREEIAHVVTSFLGLEFDNVVLFMIKGTLAEGWKAYHNDTPVSAIGDLRLSLDEPSVLKIVNEGKSFYLGPIPDTPDNAKMLAGMGGHRPEAALLVPLSIMGRVVAILYVDGGRCPVGERLGDLQKLVLKMGMAFEILILKNKILMT